MNEYNDIKSAAEVGGTHYSDKAMQPIEYIDANHLQFDEGNVIKYISRHAAKNKYEDILKCVHYALLTAKRDYSLEDSVINEVMSILKDARKKC